LTACATICAAVAIVAVVNYSAKSGVIPALSRNGNASLELASPVA
jgi:Tfp pilus assembly major pilin PilA